MLISAVYALARIKRILIQRESGSSASVTRGSHRNVLCTSSCNGDQSEIKGSSTQVSNDQGIKMAFRPQIRSESNARRIYHAHIVNSDVPSSNSSNFSCTLSYSMDIMVNY